MMTDLDGKVAICTGSGRHKGLGQGILKRLAAEGCRVVVSDVGESKEHLGEGDIGVSREMEEIAAELREAGGQAVAIACDVRDESAVRNLIDGTVKAFGRLDIVVNNAGIGYIMKHLDDLSLEEWNVVLGVNLTGAFLCTQYAARQMVAQGDGGRIINIASQAAKSGFPHMAPYVASKHGLVGLTRSCAIDLGEQGITVNAVCPNHVTTGLGARQNEYFAEFLGLSVEEYLAAMRNRIPLGRPGVPEDTAAAVAYLASDDARYITGEALNVSGGEEMH
jgi:NAD(P)-dependent dehydrogenase (short-subunit alcohol dehydrogenase family)